MKAITYINAVKVKDGAHVAIFKHPDGEVVALIIKRLADAALEADEPNTEFVEYRWNRAKTIGTRMQTVLLRTERLDALEAAIHLFKKHVSP